MSNLLAVAREEINDVDQQIVKLLAQRFRAVTQVNEYKCTHHLPILDRQREQQVLAKIAKQPIDPELTPYLQEIFKSIMTQSRQYQATRRKED